jgi:hypothetical protein
LTLKNESLQPWTFYVFQLRPSQPSFLFSLAWLVSPSMVPVGGEVTFDWEVAYNFVWGETGTIIPVGTVLDLSTTFICAPVRFPPGVASITKTLNEALMWV